jgi:predicted permease
MNTLRHDFRDALRALARQPMYAAVTILVLTLAIGANTTVFSVFNGFFLRPLPYPDDDRLVLVGNSYPKMLGAANDAGGGTSVPDYLDRREQARSLENLAIYRREERTLSGDMTPEQLLLTRASPSLFNVLGVQPLLGRSFTDEEATPGTERVVVLSHRLWRTRFGARSDAIGSDVRLDGEAFRIVGVMPQAFAFPNADIDAWVPFAFTPDQTTDANRGRDFANSIGRLRPGATIETLNAELDAIIQRNLETGRLQFPGLVEATGFTGRAQSWRARAVGDLEPMLLLLQGIVLAVLLIACANVANLQLARLTARRKEIAIRASLGAAPGRLARLLVLETLVLASAGASAGVVLALGGLELVRGLGLDRASEGFAFVMDAAVIGFTAGAALLAALTAGALPLVVMLRQDLTRVVHEAGRLGGGGHSTHGMRGALVVIQIAASATLLVGAGMLTKSFYQLQQEGAGFVADNVLTARIALPRARYADDDSRARFYAQALEALGALPGVSAAGFTSILPFSGVNSGSTVFVDGYTPAAGAPPPTAQQRSISEGYLASLDIRVIRGRDFTASEAERVAIVDDNMARTYWPDGDALGRRVSVNAPGGGGEVEWHTVVGVVPGVKHASLAEEASTPTIYWPYRQRPEASGVFSLRTTLPPERLAQSARDAILRIDPELALYDVMAMDVRLARSLGPQRAPMVLTLVFGAAAFALAVIGIYAVLTWAVTQRSGEIGVRMALGAAATDVVRMVLRQGAKLTVFGLVVGTLGALALGRLMQSQVRDVGATDPLVLGVALTSLAVAAVLASWLPARRASRIDPIEALRPE